jgi:hypothetical protein
MNKRAQGFALLLIFAFMTLSLSAHGQDAKTKPEAYHGVAIGTGGTVGGKSVQFDLRITSYTSDEELNQLATLLKEKGQSAVVSALQKKDLGRLNVTGSTGNEISIVRKRQVGDTTVLTIVTARRMSFAELYNGGRTLNYPFGYMQITFDAKGIGTGQIMAAANIRFNKKTSTYEIESFGGNYIKATNVQSWNK